MSIGFKEWALVCQALGSGVTSLILRKGGIAEGREGFRFKHQEFFLFPTFFHEQNIKTTLPPDTFLPAIVPGAITINLQATVEWTELVTDPLRVEKLAPFHILQPAVIWERFHYEGSPGLHVAFLRVYKTAEPWVLPDLARYGGCRSWVELPEMPEQHAEPVLSDKQHSERAGQLKQLLQLER